MSPAAPKRDEGRGAGSKEKVKTFSQCVYCNYFSLFAGLLADTSLLCSQARRYASRHPSSLARSSSSTFSRARA